MPKILRVGGASIVAMTAVGLFAAFSAHAQPASIRDTVRGVVFDSLANEPLSGAFIVASSGGATATSDSIGRFELISDTRVDQITAYHEALDLMGLGTIGITRPANARSWRDVVISTPSLLSIWPKVCDSRRPDRQRTGIIIGTARLADQRTRVAGAKVIVQWTPVLPSRDALHVLETVTDSLGNFVVCGVEDFAEPSMGAISAQARSGAISLPSDMRPLRRVDLMLSGIDAPGAMLRGRVVNEQGIAVPNVRVEVDGVDSATVSGADGSFSLQAVPLGSRMLSLRAVGYSPVAQVVEVAATQTAPLQLRLSRVVELEGVRVTERANVRLARRDFEDRRKAGFARFVDSSMFERAPNLRTALSMVQSGLSFPPLGTTKRRTVGPGAPTEFDIVGPNGCPAHIYLDGTQATIEEVNVIPKQNVAAVEIYRNVALAPAQFIRVADDACAVVIFWTKAGLRP